MAEQQSSAEFFAMFAHLFGNIVDCKEDNILKCKSLSRIKILLKHCDDIRNDNSSHGIIQNKIHDLIHSQLGDGKYSNTTLLNDFHHIKYGHKVEEYVDKFDAIYKTLNRENCDVTKCQYLMRHYHDRTQISNTKMKTDPYNSKSYALSLVSRVHTYLIHSYDLNKLSINETKQIKKEINDFKQSIKSDDSANDGDEYEIKWKQKQLEILFKIMSNKKGKTLEIIKRFHAKYIEPIDDKYQLFMDVLHADPGLDSLLSSLYWDEYDTESIYDDLQERDDSNIYLYLKQHLNHKLNQWDVLKELCVIYKPIVDRGKLMSEQQQHKTYILAQFCGFTNAALESAKAFLNATNWDITVSIDRYFMFDGDITKIQMDHDGGDSNDNHHKRDSTKLKAFDINSFNINSDNNDVDIYSLGTKYWYWSSLKNQPNYIESKYKNIKTEILYHDAFDCNISIWNDFTQECNAKLDTKQVRDIVSNGQNVRIYNIKHSVAFDLQHIQALLLYTNFTSWCAIFCNTLRDGDKVMIRAFAHWARLLIECVQCYGSLLSSSNNDTVYRGINRAFTFKKFIASFNVPLSTTTELMKAAEFAGFATSFDGLVMQLCDYDAIYNVFSFDCSIISAFAEEKEILFYGGDTILKIQSIHQIVNGKWIDYKTFVEATICITRLMNGLAIHMISKSGKKTMRRILKSLLNASSTALLPKYIAERLIKYHIRDRTDDVELDYTELMTKYKWMKSIFIKDKIDNILNIYNICYLFQKCNNIIINMPDDEDTEDSNVLYDRDVVLTETFDTIDNIETDSNKTFDVSLKHDLSQLFNDNVSFHKIELCWSSGVPLTRKFNIINLFATDYRWNTQCSPTTIQIIPTKGNKQDIQSDVEETKKSEDIMDEKVQDVGGLDFEEEQQRGDDLVETDEEDEDLIMFYWDIDKSLLAEFEETKECQSEEIEIDDFKWLWKLQYLDEDPDDRIEFSLCLLSLPVHLGALKLNVTISCDNLSYIQAHNGIVMSLKDKNVTFKQQYLTNITDSIDPNQFNNLNSMQFKCSVEILVNYDLFGGIFSEVDKAIYVSPSERNSKIVYGYLNNEIHNFNFNDISASPLSIYNLIYEYYLMLINVRHSYSAQFLWKFNTKKELNLFFNCNHGDVITSRKFEINGWIYYMELTPNGWDTQIPVGSCALWVAVHKLPKGIKSGKTIFRVICDEIGYDTQRTETLTESSLGGVFSMASTTKDWMPLDQFKHLKSFQFKFYIHIQSMLDFNGKTIINESTS